MYWKWFYTDFNEMCDQNHGKNGANSKIQKILAVANFLLQSYKNSLNFLIQNKV